jgi:hypothetical protein
MNVNATLAYNELPEKMYHDSGYAQLKFLRGNPGTVGYERFRRIYRIRSVNNR